ncbi:MAG: hypothetical protein ACREAM_18120, partial [Blastocatellia bacterium]
PTLTKEECEALIDEAREKLKPVELDQRKNAVVEYISAHHPAVRCSSVKQLNRLLEKFGLESKFNEREDGTKT